MPERPRTWIDISGAALRYNYRWLRAHVPVTTAMLPIVKANGYGHGVTHVISALRRVHRGTFGVAHADEALNLRLHGVRSPLIVLSSWQPADLRSLIAAKVEFVVADRQSWQHVQRLPTSWRRRARIHLKLDVGTHRLGFLPEDVTWLRQQVQQRRDTNVVGVFSHLARAEEEPVWTKQQIQRFATLKDSLGLHQGIRSHIACTAAIITSPEAHFSLVRPGIGLYGIWPSERVRAQAKGSAGLRPALTWLTTIQAIRRVPTGSWIGYGRTFRTTGRSRIATIPVGYSDGYDRRLSNTGWVVIRGHRAPVRGRVCMNLTMVDVTNIPQAAVGDTVTLIGAKASVTELSTAADMLSYELVSRIHPSITRTLR